MIADLITSLIIKALAWWYGRWKAAREKADLEEARRKDDLWFAEIEKNWTR